MKVTVGSIVGYFSVAFVLGFGTVFGLMNSSLFIAQNTLPPVATSSVQEFDIGGPSAEDLEKIELIPNFQEFLDASKKYVIRQNAEEFPRVSAESFLVADIDNGAIIAQRDPKQVYPIASITKLMTAVVAVESIDQDSEVTISRNAINTYGSQGRLQAGEVYTVEELLYPLLLESSNDTAEALAEYIGREDFLERMNGKAQSLSMSWTQFRDPSGLSAGNTSSAQDLFELLTYAYKKHPNVLEVTTLKKHKGKRITWYNNSSFRNDENYLGGKNGYTDEARNTQVIILELPLDGDTKFRNIAITILRSRDIERDIRNIVSFLNKYVYFE